MIRVAVEAFDHARHQPCTGQSAFGKPFLDVEDFAGDMLGQPPVLAPKFADRTAGFKPRDVDGEDVEVFPHQFVQQFGWRDFPVWHAERVQRIRSPMPTITMGLFMVYYLLLIWPGAFASGSVTLGGLL